MAERPIFVCVDKAPFYKIVYVGFDQNSGPVPLTKQGRMDAIRCGFQRLYPQKKILELSRGALWEDEPAPGDFLPLKAVSSLGQSLPAEQIWQASKVFEKGGPFTDLLTRPFQEAKADKRLKNSGELTGFCFEEQGYPARPGSVFFDWLFVNALLENERQAETLLRYDGFSDAACPPKKIRTCPARAAAVFASVSKLGLAEKLRDFDDFFGLLYPGLHFQNKAGFCGRKVIQ